MSKLTSLMNSGKRTILRLRNPLGWPDRRASQDPLRPIHDVRGAGFMNPLGLPDQGISQDPLRPAYEVAGEESMTPLGRRDQGISEDPLSPLAG